MRRSSYDELFAIRISIRKPAFVRYAAGNIIADYEMTFTKLAEAEKTFRDQVARENAASRKPE